MMSSPSEKVPLSAEQEVRPGEVQYIAATPQQAEAVYIHNASYIVHDQYKGRLSIILGIILIVIQTLAIVLNIIGAAIQSGRGDYVYWIPGNYSFFLFASLWCGIFVYISAGFAIAAGKVKSRGLIIAHLVLSCIACVFSFTCACLSCGGIVYEANHDIHSGTDKASVSIAVLWLVACWVIFILVTWCAVLCCRILCCGKDSVVTETEIVTPIHAPPGTLLNDAQPIDKDSAPPPYKK